MIGSLVQIACIVVAGACAGTVTGNATIGIGVACALYVLMPYHPRS